MRDSATDKWGHTPIFGAVSTLPSGKRGHTPVSNPVIPAGARQRAEPGPRGGDGFASPATTRGPG